MFRQILCWKWLAFSWTLFRILVSATILWQNFYLCLRMNIGSTCAIFSLQPSAAENCGRFVSHLWHAYDYVIQRQKTLCWWWVDLNWMNWMNDTSSLDFSEMLSWISDFEFYWLGSKDLNNFTEAWPVQFYNVAFVKLYIAHIYLLIFGNMFSCNYSVYGTTLLYLWISICVYLNRLFLINLLRWMPRSFSVSRRCIKAWKRQLKRRRLLNSERMYKDYIFIVCNLCTFWLQL